MRTCRHLTFALAASLAALGSASSVSATSVALARPHDPAQACAAVKELVADLNAGQPYGGDRRSFRMYFTDTLGFVEPDEVDEFSRSMRYSNGKKDRREMEVEALHRLDVDGTDATYVVRLSRSSWELKRYEENGMLMLDEIDDPHWAVNQTYWLVDFSSNEISRFREAFEIYSLTSQDNKVEGC